MSVLPPTKLTDKQILQFQELYIQKYGKPISLEKSQELGLYLMQLIFAVYR